MKHERENPNLTGLEIAVIGMAGRFPGARNISEFWENLKQGVESVSFFSDPELEEAGVSTELTVRTDYVKGRGFLEGSEYFDAVFFEYLPAEVEVMDPQMRLFHECAWTALEDSGYDPGAYPGFIGIYAGASPGLNWQALSILSGTGGKLDHFSTIQLRDKDFLATRLAYKLNLKGPAFILATACSTSLVAVNLACQGMLSGECDMALAGGVSLPVPQKNGYIYQDGMINSADGHCRAFDSRAKGTVSGSGVAVVVLKLLEQAVADRDHIYAVIKGSATNNDGFRKAGFSAPSIDGQAEVIKTAMQLASVAPESIGYVETHGTGTKLGDPVEMAALKLAFDTEQKGYCAIGSVKSNIGHLDSAAGVTGLIKVVLVLNRKMIPPSLHFENPNPEIDFGDSPFYVNNRLREWDRGNGHPRRASVSSFGIGGTNAHVVLEEYESEISQRSISQHETISNNQNSNAQEKIPSSLQLILLSAKTPTALTKQAQNLADYFTKNPGIHIADAAYTLQTGRKAFKYRKMFTCETAAEAVDFLTSANLEQVKSFVVRKEDRPVFFMFSGQGSQYVNMGLELYQKEKTFREEMDRCFAFVIPLIGFDLKEVLYPHQPDSKNLDEKRFIGKRKGTAIDINRTSVAQPVIFMVEYALTKLVMSWGIEPSAMIGHSIGEYTAACLSGVFSLEDALKLVVNRGRLMQRMPTGAMLGVSVPEEEIIHLIKDKNLSLAAVNSSKQCVVSGGHEAVDAFAEELESLGIKNRRLFTSHAFHSPMMEPILEEFTSGVASVKLNEPRVPFVSNVSGTWITNAEAVDPAYWAQQIRGTVRFADGLRELLKDEHALLIEAGAGNALCTFVRQHDDKKNGQHTVNLMRHAKEEEKDVSYLLNRIGMCWLFGAKIDWNRFHAGEELWRIPLPTYPFEGQRFQAEGDPFNQALNLATGKSDLHKKPDMADWFYVPSWERSQVEGNCGETEAVSSPWLVFIDEYGRAEFLIEELNRQKEAYIRVRTGTTFTRVSAGEYMLNPAEPGDYDSLFSELKGLKKVPGRIGHFWTVTGENVVDPDLENIDVTQDMGFFSLLYLVQAMGRQEIIRNIRIVVVSDGLHRVTGEEAMCPGKATLLAAVKIIPLEYPNIMCKSIDITGGGLTPDQENIFLQELRSVDSRNVVALRGRFSWVPVWKPRRFTESRNINRHLKDKGVYLITGGMGGMGFTLAEYLALSKKSRLILIGRSHFPARREWDRWLAEHGPEDKVNRKIKRIRNWEKNGAETMIESADISNFQQVREIVERAQQRFGPINGVLHTAGVADFEGIIQRRNRQKTEAVMAPKVKGALVLDRLLQDVQLDFFLLFSSLGNVLYKLKFGEVGYNAANEFLDAYAWYKSGSTGTFVAAINWCDWLEVGMSIAALQQRKTGEVEPRILELQAAGSVTPAQGVTLFNRILDSDQVHVCLSPQDLDALRDYLAGKGNEDPASPPAADEDTASAPSYQFQERPDLSSEYVAPGNEIEKRLARIWQEYFGIGRVGIHDDFFELGGDSLQAMTITSHIRKILKIVIPIQLFFAKPTVKMLAQYIAAGDKKDRIAYTAVEPAEEKEYYLLSSAQKRIYVLQQMDKSNTSYNQLKVENLNFEPEKGKIAETFRRLILRHKMLRTSFESIETEPVQKIHSPGEIEFAAEFYDAEDRNPQQIIRHFVRPFDLGHAPLFRAGMIKTESGRYLLTVDLHHIISDGTSNALFVNEFIQLYNGEELFPLKLQYKDFSVWQNNRRESGDLKKQEEYWLKEFAGGATVLNLPFDYARPRVRDSAGGKLRFVIGKDELEKLREIAHFTDSTMFMVILALYNIFLSKLSGREDIVIGTVTAGRGHPGLENLIGMFVNTLALRNYPAEEKTFIDFLKEIKKRTLDAFANQDYQFEELVDALQAGRETGRNPLFDVVFTYSGEQRLQAVETDSKQPDYYQDTQSKFDLTLSGIEREGLLIFYFTYAAGLFKGETIERFATYFREILTAVTKDKGIKLGDMTISHDLDEIKSDVYRGKESDFDF